MAGPLPYLVFNDVEVSNGQRIISYLQRGLANTNQGHWELGDGELCGVLSRTNGGTCATPFVFVHPAVDPAPWYDASEPGSASFLGFMLTGIIGYDSTIVRSATQRLGGLGGGTLSAQYRKPREWRFRGALVSADDVGAEYGLRWLTSVLESSACELCSTAELSVRLTCPDDDCSDDTNGFWTSYEAALISGPYEVEPNSPGSGGDWLGGCRDMVMVEFTVVAGNPWLYKPAVVCLPAQSLGGCVPNCTNICDFLTGAGTAPCCTVSSPQRGILGGIFTFVNNTSTPTGQIQIESRAECGDSIPLLAMGLSSIPAFSTVVVDCSRHTVTVIDSSGAETDGQYLLVVVAGTTIQWIEVADCEEAACLCARQVSSDPHSPVITVEIATQIREG